LEKLGVDFVAAVGRDSQGNSNCDRGMPISLASMRSVVGDGDDGSVLSQGLISFAMRG